MTWLEEVRDEITAEIVNPQIIPCGSSDGSIRQCEYLGQTVFVYVPTILPCDVGTRVVDCNGDFVFSYGGFCLGPCPGDDEVQFLENCEVIYRVPRNLICDNSCTDSNSVLMGVGCVTADANATSICVPITTRNFNDVAFMSGGLQWDPSLLVYTGINEVGFTNISLDENNVLTGTLGFFWGAPGLPYLLPDDIALFEICFDIIGPVGSMAIIDLVDLPNFTVEAGNGIGLLQPLCTENGKVSLGSDSSDLEVNFCDDNDIPTLGQWALICLSILFMIVGVVSIKEIENAIGPVQLNHLEN